MIEGMTEDHRRQDAGGEEGSSLLPASELERIRRSRTHQRYIGSDLCKPDCSACRK